MRTSIIATWLLFACWQNLFGQDQSVQLAPIQGNAASSKESARWTFSPTLFPYVPVINRLSDINDVKINITNDNGIIYGFRVEKYFPNSKKGFGVEMDYLNREIVATDANRYYFAENAISLMPFYSIKSGGIEKINHKFLEFGLKNQYTFYNSVYRSDGVESFDDYNLSLLKKFRLYGYLGFGLKRDEFNKESKRIGLSTLSAGIFFPIFNQANLTRNRKFNYPTEFEIFRKGNYVNAYLVINYVQNIDWKKSTDGGIYQIPPGAILSTSSNFKPQKYLPPLVHWTNPETNLFGNFFLHSVFQPQVDTVQLTSSIYSDTNLIIKSSISWKVGYTFHFLGKYSQYNLGENERGGRYDLFVSANFLNQIYNLKGSQEARINKLSFELSGGGRVGLYPPGIFVFAGYTQRFDLANKLLVNLDETKDFNFANLGHSSIFVGLSIKNAINFRVIVTPSIKTLKKSEPKMDKLSFSIGFGI